MANKKFEDYKEGLIKKIGSIKELIATFIYTLSLQKHKFFTPTPKATLEGPKPEAPKVAIGPGLTKNAPVPAESTEKESEKEKRKDSK